MLQLWAELPGLERVDYGAALTFDDGPDPDGTPDVLAALDSAQIRATFFLVGEQVVRYPSIAAEIAAAGHEIAIHGYRHVLLLRRAPAALRRDFVHAQDVISTATGTEPTLYRPPYGVFSGPALLIARGLGWRTLLWSRWGRDWERRATAEKIAARASRSLTGGDVVLLHDADHYSSVGSWRRTVAALPSILDAVSASGEPLVSASHST
jgi:peptidoglycan/xylan/chitin deacetylase (PgdA/CDA1 family)